MSRLTTFLAFMTLILVSWAAYEPRTQEDQPSVAQLVSIAGADLTRFHCCHCWVEACIECCCHWSGQTSEVPKFKVNLEPLIATVK